MGLRWIASLAAALAFSLVGFAQDTDDEVVAQVDKYLRHAQSGNPGVRPQAAQRLVGIGAPAAARILELAGDDPAGLAQFGSDVVEVLGEFESTELRSHTWGALHDPDFPWRPAAARTLARTATGFELGSLTELLDDPLAAVRAAAVEGFAHLDARDHEPLVRALLLDEDDRTRRAAAVLLDTWGHREALAWLVEDLKRTDRFFDLPTGKQARFQALGMLQRQLGESLAFRADLEPDAPENVEALAAIEARCRELRGDATPELAPWARAGGASIDAAFGVELRSCRRGEFFLRFGAGDALWVGTGNAARVQLPEGTTARLAEALAEPFAELADERFWGSFGCDSEQYFWTPPGADSVDTYRVMKGQRSVDGLRPDALGRVAATLLEVLPDEGDDPRVASLRSRLGLALEAVGGALPSE